MQKRLGMETLVKCRTAVRIRNSTSSVMQGLICSVEGGPFVLYSTGMARHSFLCYLHQQQSRTSIHFRQTTKRAVHEIVLATFSPHGKRCRMRSFPSLCSCMTEIVTAARVCATAFPQ